jgi:hypothetical protein
MSFRGMVDAHASSGTAVCESSGLLWSAPVLLTHRRIVPLNRKYKASIFQQFIWLVFLYPAS